jgi:DNA invertase Pin-like site-specific DNA recombinase
MGIEAKTCEICELDSAISFAKKISSKQAFSSLFLIREKSSQFRSFLRKETMKNYIFGYARVSTVEQNLDRQLDALKHYGVHQIYNEKITGKKRDRPELVKMLDRMTEGDTVVIESLSRLGRSTKDLIELVELFERRNVALISLKESIDTNTPTGKLLFTLMSAIAQFERDCISDRTIEGLKAARARGRVGGRPRIAGEPIKRAVKLYKTGQHSLREIEELTGIKKDTLYRNLEVKS